MTSCCIRCTVPFGFSVVGIQDLSLLPVLSELIECDVLNICFVVEMLSFCILTGYIFFLTYWQTSRIIWSALFAQWTVDRTKNLITNKSSLNIPVITNWTTIAILKTANHCYEFKGEHLYDELVFRTLYGSDTKLGIITLLCQCAFRVGGEGSSSDCNQIGRG